MTDWMKSPISRRMVLAAPALALVACTPGANYAGPTEPGEVEATEFEGVQLTPIAKQRTNALGGVQDIDRESYRLTIDGLVAQPLQLSYADLQAYPQHTWVLPMNCVEGWSYQAKWSGPALAAILADAGVQADAKVAIFHTTDTDRGYTALDLDFLTGEQILLGMRLNDITLPTHKGFPFQLVARAKFGYKWAKWVQRIEISGDADFRGFWERSGYNNNADDTGPAFG